MRYEGEMDTFHMQITFTLSDGVHRVNLEDEQNVRK